MWGREGHFLGTESCWEASRRAAASSLHNRSIWLQVRISNSSMGEKGPKIKKQLGQIRISHNHFLDTLWKPGMPLRDPKDSFTST